MIALDKIISGVPQINEKNRNYVMGGILLAVFAVYYFIVMQPQLAALRALNPEITILKEDLQKAKDDIGRLNLYLRQVNELDETVKTLGGQVRPKEEVHLILESISVSANENRIRVEQMVPVFDGQQQLLKTKEGVYYSLPVTMDVRGGYHDFGRFLSDIENHQVSLKVKKFSIVASPQDNLKHVIKLTLDAIIIEAAKE